METVAVLGASSKPDRYSYKAMAMLMEYGHTAIPVHPKEKTVCEQTVFADLKSIEVPIDTVTVYVKPETLLTQLPQILAHKPRRVILNPGTESDTAKQRLQEEGIDVQEACTLVLLKTGQF